ncbi:MAG: FxsA family protein [Thermoguttaceae bacterium]
MRLRTFMAIVCALVAVDLLLFAPVCFLLGWQLPLVESLLSGGMGILVIGYYEWRWAGLIADRLGGECPEPLGTAQLERILLIVAGLFLILPGILSTILGMLMLLPPVRRLTAHALPLGASGANERRVSF